MVGKKSGRALLREEGLARTDNNMGLTSWPQITAINQKNYYTEYLKRDDQILAYRMQQDEARNRMAKKAKDRDRALALGDPAPAENDEDQEMEDDQNMEHGSGELGGQDAPGSKVIVMHIGSQNLRVGLSSDALPKTVPMVIAKKAAMNESEEGDGEPAPKRAKLDDGSWPEPEKQFGPEFAKTYTTMCADLKTRMRLNKRRVLPNSKEMVINYNRRTPPDTIPEHNDPLRIDWTEILPNAAPEWVTGKDALRIPDNSRPRYKLFWPIRHGLVNERDYCSRHIIFQDILLIITDAIKSQLGLDVRTRRDWAQYGGVFIIPDLYERAYVIGLLEMAMRDLGFGRVCFIQESLAASFGAGYTTTCIVDIGAQTTSICCVEEGMCVENSRINLKVGGWDITETFVRMMLYDHFPYEDINLKRRYDFLLAEEIKQKFCTMNEGEVSVQVLDFHLRASGQDTRKYSFKAYDEVLLAPMGLFAPTIFNNSEKLAGRHQVLDRSRDLYDASPNDPTSQAQADILRIIAPHLVESTPQTNGQTNGDVNGTPARPQPNPQLGRLQEAEATPRSSVTGSPAPEGEEQPTHRKKGTPPPIANAAWDAEPDAPPEPLAIEYRDDVLSVFPLDSAILTSISYAAKGDERKTRDYLGGIMVIGGGSQIPGFSAYLEEKLHALRPMYAKDIMIGTPPRELDAQVVVWKGASVFGKLSQTNDSWIGQMEYDRLGSRLLAYKCMWAW